jgi:hypothetical protein
MSRGGNYRNLIGLRQMVMVSWTPTTGVALALFEGEPMGVSWHKNAPALVL